jgi:hypothetical protein
MNPLVFMILKAERDLKAEQEKYIPKYDDIKTSKLALQSEQKTRKRFFHRLRSQKNCECS